MGTLLGNVWTHLLAFGFLGDPTWLHNFAGRPMLNPVEALLFWTGVGMAGWRWQRQPACRLLLIWLLVLVLPAMLAKDSPPSTLRMIGAAPSVYLLIGMGMWESLQFLKKRFVRYGGTWASIALGSVVGILILVQGADTYRVYFNKWVEAPETYEAHGVRWTELARMLGEQPPAADTLFLIPGYTWFSGFWWQYSFGYLYQGPTPTQMVSVGRFNLAPAVESSLAEMEDISTVKLVDWDNKKVGGDAYADELIVPPSWQVWTIPEQRGWSQFSDPHFYGRFFGSGLDNL